MITLKEAEFDVSAINENITGAGVLPIAKHNGKIYCLLGKERFINHWRGSLKWSGFEGGRKPNEKIEYTAAREFVEECIGIVKIDGKSITIDSVLQFILEKRYFAKIVICICHNDFSEKRYHVTYVIEVDYQHIEEEFQAERKRLIDLNNKSNQVNKLYADLFENKDLIVESKTTLNGQRINAVTNVSFIDNRFCIEFVNIDNRTSKVIHHDLDDHICVQYIRWFCLRKELTDNTNLMNRYISLGAIEVERNCIGATVDVTLNEDYLEKQAIKWWSLSELKNVFKNGGFLNNEFFRAYFLPVLQTTIKEIEMYEE